jgi:hypothetical protein
LENCYLFKKDDFMETTLTYLQHLTAETHTPEAEVLTRAFQVGLRQLWREHILGQFLRQEISREKAVEMVGIDLVELAERQHQAMMEDIQWALDD